MTTQANIKDDYLSEMSIDPWYPRARLVNALPPSVVAIVDPKLQDNAAPLLESIKAIPKPDLNDPILVETQSEALKQLETHAVNKVETKPLVKNDTKESVRFGLGVYVVGEYVIASSLISQHEVLQDQAWRLMQNILLTLSSTDHPLLYHHSIFWPFFQNKNADQSLDSAKEYVDEFIGHLSEQYKTKKIIAFGGVLPKLKQWSPDSSHFKPDIHLVLPSLYKMLNNPAEKAKAWQLIQASPFK